MLSRVATSSTGVGYRYGLNGKEDDFGAKGALSPSSQDQLDYGMRIYDPRVGRFLSVDPLQRKFADLSPYHFSGNTPIQAVDIDGREPKGYMDYWKEVTDPYMTRWGYTVQDFYDYKTKQVWTVMNYPNTDEYFYWQTKYEQAEHLFKPYNTSLNKTDNDQWTGLFKGFTPTHLSEDRSLYYGMLGMLASPFIAMGLIEGGGAAINALYTYGNETAINAATKGIQLFYRYAPIAGALGKALAEFFDESGGSVMTGGSGGIKLAEATFQEGKNLLGAVFKFEGGKALDFLGNKVINGKTLELTDVILYPQGAGGNEMKNEFGKDAIKAVVDKLKEYAKSLGFEKLRITGERAANSSSANPGHTFDYTINLND